MPPEETLKALVITPCFPPQSRPPPAHFLSLQILDTSHRVVLLCPASSTWHNFSTFVHIVPCVSASLLFIAEQNSGWVVSTFWLF